MPEPSTIHIITDPQCVDYEMPGHPESPRRIRKTVERLRRQRELKIQWLAPQPVADKALLKAHSRAHLDRLKVGLDFDPDTPAHPDIARHARRSVGGALRALRCALRRRHSFSLLRPPGHHATREMAMGFCYLNNIAVATLAARAARVPRVAVLDFDVHHGNGTEEILLDRPGVAFYSIHQFPAYPGSGRKNRGENCFNIPVPPGLAREAYRDLFSQVLTDLKTFNPSLLAVSAGFDAYARDPLCQQQLEAEDYHWMGQQLSALDLPMFSLLEGGYSEDLPELILAYLRGVSGLGLQKTAPPTEESDAMPGEESFWGLGDLLA